MNKFPYFRDAMTSSPANRHILKYLRPFTNSSFLIDDTAKPIMGEAYIGAYIG